MGRYQTNINDECGTGCWVSKRRDDLSAEDIVFYFQSICHSKAFLEELANAGLEQPCYVPNDVLTWGNSAYDNFRQALSSESSVVDSSASLGLVFHGTPQNNIGNILNTGLNPRLRSRQKFGRGEYFAKDPVFSLEYTKQYGREMLVFVVVLPPDNDQENPKSDKCPDETVVVSRNEHQLPLGKITFTSRNGLKVQKRMATIKGNPFLFEIAVISAIVALAFLMIQDDFSVFGVVEGGQGIRPMEFALLWIGTMFCIQFIYELALFTWDALNYSIRCHGWAWLRRR